jgi:hypothetical protein
MYPVDAPGVVDRFYTGLNPGEALPWSAWLGPMFWALSASLAMTAIGVGITAIFQKQWSEHERLSFPLAQVPLALTEGFDRRRGWPPFMVNWMFWVGFGVAAIPILFNIIEYFVTGFPRIALFDAYYGPSGPRGDSVSRYIEVLSYRLLPTVMGFTFLCDLNILFSIWSLYIVGLGVRYGMNRVGFAIGLSGQEAKTNEILGLFVHGVMIGLVFWAIWVSRGHLKRVWHQVLHPVSAEHSDTGFVSVRWAFGALVGGGLYMVLAARRRLRCFNGRPVACFVLGGHFCRDEIPVGQRFCLSVPKLGSRHPDDLGGHVPDVGFDPCGHESGELARAVGLAVACCIATYRTVVKSSFGRQSLYLWVCFGWRHHFGRVYHLAVL